MLCSMSRKANRDTFQIVGVCGGCALGGAVGVGGGEPDVGWKIEKCKMETTVISIFQYSEKGGISEVKSIDQSILVSLALDGLRLT